MSFREVFANQRRKAASRKASFRDRWQAFCLTFDSSEELAASFGVSIRCADYWREGVVAGNGAAVDAAYQDFPEQAARHLRTS